MKSELPAIVFGLAGFASVVGTPHVLVSAECETFRSRCTRDIVQCAYVGIQGRREVFPMMDGDEPQGCGEVALLPLRWPLVQWTSR